MRSASRLREGATCLATLVVVASVAFIPYALHGGFFSDDWATASDVRVSPGTGYAGAVGQISKELGARPLLAVALPLPHVLFGESPRAQVLFGLFIGLLTCLCFIVVLRMLGLAQWHAIGIASLALLFPWADSVRLWPSAAVNSLALVFFFGGVALALLGLTARGWRSLALGAGSTGLYLASVLTYEVAGLAACLVGALYVRAAPRRRAVGRWTADVIVVLAALAWSAHATRGVRHVASVGQVGSDIPSFVRQGSSLLATSLLAFPGIDSGLAKAAILVAAVAVVVLAVRRLRRSRDPALRRWLSVVTLSVVALCAAYAMLLGSFLHPLDRGLDNRGNVFAAFAFAGIVYGLIALAAHLVPRRRAVVGLTLFALVAAGWVVRVQRDGGDWGRARNAQSRVLADIQRQLPTMPRGTSLVAAGFPGETAPGVPVFDATWDLEGALRLQRNDPGLHAYPLFADGSLVCAPDGAVATGPGSFGRHVLAYGRLVVVSPTERAWVANRVQCEHAVKRFPLLPRRL